VSFPIFCIYSYSGLSCGNRSIPRCFCLLSFICFIIIFNMVGFLLAPYFI
jgi:hypothetical protein